MSVGMDSYVLYVFFFCLWPLDVRSDVNYEKTGYLSLQRIVLEHFKRQPKWLQEASGVWF